MESKPLISPDEAKLLIDLLETNEIRGNILEIGSFSCDGSTRIFAEHIREHGGSLHMADIFCVDGFEERCRKATEDIDARILKGFSSELADQCDCRYGFAFIDGDHGYPRILANGHQSGVACDIAAWHRHLEVGGIMAFHDYTGDRDTLGNIKYLPIEYAVDSLCAHPFYEYVGRAGLVIAFRKLREGVLPHAHRPKKAPADYRDVWAKLDAARTSGVPFILFGSAVACERVAESVRTAFTGDHPMSFCPLEENGDPVPDLPLLEREALFREDSLIITAGTVGEEERMLALIKDEQQPVNHATFMEWFGWYFIGRYGYR